MDAYTEHRKGAALTHRETRLIVFGVMLPVFIGAMDNTILATALPTIGRDFGDIRNLPWLITSPAGVDRLHAALRQDRRHPRPAPHALRRDRDPHGGSLVCALAPTMCGADLGARVQGIGGGGLSSIAMVVLGDVAAPKERGRYSPISPSSTPPPAAAARRSAASCPTTALVGDLLAQHSAGLAALAGHHVAAAPPAALRAAAPARPDRRGADRRGERVVHAGAQSRRRALRWTSPPILALFAAAVVVGVLFVWRLLTAPEPLIPIAMLKRADRALGDHRQRLRLGRHRRAQHLPADLPAERDRPVADRRRA